MKKITKTFRKLLAIPIVKMHFPENPIIVCGCARTGTTLIQSILGAHPNIYSLKTETGEFTGGWERNRKGELQPKRFDRFYKYFLENKIPFGPKRYCTKRPRNVHYLKEIIEYHDNNLKIIQMIRNPIDTLTSLHPTKEAGYYVSISRYIQDTRAGFDFFDHPLVHIIKYENLVTNFNKTIKKALVFLEEEYTKELDNWTQHTTIKKSAAWFHNAKKIHKESIGRKNRKRDKKRIKKIINNTELVEIAEKIGYNI